MFIFQPILKERIWGGHDIRPFKKLIPNNDVIGESWELSQVEGDLSVVDNGVDKGKTISELMQKYGGELLGNKVEQKYGHQFPLLIKIIDAKDDLSVQVHPNDALAQLRNQPFGKTEMWYVIKASPDATLYSGFSKKITPDEYVRRVENDTIMEVLNKFDVQQGDVFFLPTGRVHAIGKGCFIAEIQQTSDITYRIYDYHRVDKNGNTRQLHTELAKDAIDFNYYDGCKTNYLPQKNKPVTIAACDYFTTQLLDLDQTVTRDFSKLDSFVIYLCVHGRATFTDNDNNQLNVAQGQTILVKANTKTLTITPDNTATLLESYVDLP
jgi:mannose-6-phosphate isomerase